MKYFNFKDITFSYDNKNIILENFSFDLYKGEILLIKGKSGIGKSTILKLIAGIEVANSGKIILDNVDITNEKMEKRNVAYLFQEFSLFPHLSIKENILYSISKREKEYREKRLKELLELIELENYENKSVLEISGGEKQRVALARALAKIPKLLLLDEPFSSLNEELRENLRKQLKKILKKLNISTIIVSHNKEDEIIADRIIEINK